MRYRRAYCDGGCYFFTVVTRNRRRILTSPHTVNVLRDAFRHVRSRYPFRIEAIVILPDHLHCVWRLPTGDSDFSTRWRLVKTYVSNRVGASVWQPRFWEHQIRDDTDYAHHLDYIHYNPVKHGYAARPQDWKHSSLVRFVKQGVYPPDWGARPPDIPAHIGRE